MSFDHDRPNSLDPNAWEWQHVTEEGATVLVSKVGGGTIGRRYDGAWHYSYTRRDHHDEGSDMWTGSPASHAEVAEMVAEFIEQHAD